MVDTKEKQAEAFLLGTFISSLGSTTLQISLMAFMKIGGYSIFEIGIIVGGGRFVNLLISLTLGDLADRVRVRILILVTELIAAVIAGMLAWTWSLGQSGFGAFLFFYLIRAAMLAIQQPGRSKISKLLSGDTYLSNSRQAIWLNKVTHGSMFFAAGLSVLAISFGSFYWAILFDALTFLVNSLIILGSNFGKTANEANNKKTSIFRKFKDFYFFNSRTAIFDLFLALALCGGNLFTVRIAGDHEVWIPIYLTSYGLAVWVTGYLERLEVVRQLHGVIWLGFGISFFLLGRFPNQGAITWLIFILNDHCYWLLFHRYSSKIQTQTPKEKIASVSSARAVQMILVLASGELLVGTWQKWVPVFWEGTWRAILCILIAAVLGLGLISKEDAYEKAPF